MKNKLVVIGCMIFQGIMHILNPRGSLQWSAGMLSIFIVLYALVSMIFILTRNNKTVGKGKKIAGDFVHGVVKGNKDPAINAQEFMVGNKIIDKKRRSRITAGTTV